MEKLPDGKCVFRNPRLEERVAKIFEDDILRKREKIMLQVEKEIENEEKTTTRGSSKFQFVYCRFQPTFQCNIPKF